MCPSALRTAVRFWLWRASTWAGTTLRQTSKVKALMLASRTRASTARAMRATAASRGTASPGAFSGMAVTSPPGTVMWKLPWMWRCLVVLGFMWTTHKAYWHSTGWVRPWRSSTSTRRSSWSLCTRRSGCPRKRTMFSWWRLGNLYLRKPRLLPPHLQQKISLHKPLFLENLSIGEYCTDSGK